MEYSKLINYKINELVDLLLTDGVRPGDLSDNIFDQDYIDIRYYKDNGYIIGELIFNSDNLLVKMIYTYSQDRRILRIEEEIQGRKEIVWDRSMREKEIIEEIVYFIKLVYNPEQIHHFLMSLPNAVGSSILSEYSKTA